MILVDTCVWIDFLNGKSTRQTDYFLKLKESQYNEICLSHIIYFELLRAIRSEWDRKKLKKILDQFIMLDFKNDDFEELIRVYQLCLEHGLSLPKIGDWLILKTVLDHSLELLTSDRGFHKIRKFYPFRLVGE